MLKFNKSFLTDEKIEAWGDCVTQLVSQSSDPDLSDSKSIIPPPKNKVNPWLFVFKSLYSSKEESKSEGKKGAKFVWHLMVIANNVFMPQCLNWLK